MPVKGLTAFQTAGAGGYFKWAHAGLMRATGYGQTTHLERYVPDRQPHGVGLRCALYMDVVLMRRCREFLALRKDIARNRKRMYKDGFTK